MSLNPPASPASTTLIRMLGRPEAHAILGIAILLLDYATGPHLLFPILFVLPVCLSAWFYSARWALALAILLPLGRLAIAAFVDSQAPLGYSVLNALIRITVLALLAYFVGRTARQAREMRATISGFVTMCAWSRTVQHEGEWISFEEYLRRRFGIETTHGIAPEALEKMQRAIQEQQQAPE